MANLKLYPLQEATYFAFGQFDFAVIGRHVGNYAIYHESPGADYIEIKGKGLEFDGAEIVKGTITSMTHYDADGVKYAAITGLEFKAKNLPDLETGRLWAFYTGEAMLAGKDKITGSSRNDALEGLGGRDIIKGLGGIDDIYGGAGNDRLTGGSGADEFYIFGGEGHDTITDFESRGPDETHDHIYAEAGDYTVRQRGDNTLIEFDNGTSITLLDFKKAHLDDGDVVLI